MVRAVGVPGGGQGRCLTLGCTASVRGMGGAAECMPGKPSVHGSHAAGCGSGLCLLQVDYYLALGARQFVGNSASTYSALAIMERWQRESFASYYNGGHIPLEAFLPLYK